MTATTGKKGDEMTEAKNSERRWVIVGPHGLYVGQRMRRIDMIAQHVGERLSGVKLDDIRFPELPTFAHNGLSKDQKRAWEWCKRRGDRCVHAKISW